MTAAGGVVDGDDVYGGAVHDENDDHPRSMAICRDLETKYNLQKATEQEHKQTNKVFKPVNHKDGDIKSQIASIRKIQTVSLTSKIFLMHKDPKLAILDLSSTSTRLNLAMIC